MSTASYSKPAPKPTEGEGKPDPKMVAETTMMLAIALAGMFEQDARSAQEVAEKHNSGSDGRPIDRQQGAEYLRLARITATISESLVTLALTGLLFDLPMVTVAIETAILKALRAEKPTV